MENEEKISFDRSSSNLANTYKVRKSFKIILIILLRTTKKNPP